MKSLLNRINQHLVKKRNYILNNVYKKRAFETSTSSLILIRSPTPIDEIQKFAFPKYRDILYENYWEYQNLLIKDIHERFGGEWFNNEDKTI